MAKPTTRAGTHGTARPAAALTPPVSPPKAETPTQETPPASGRIYYVALAVWVGGFLALTLLLFAESLPLLWDLIRLRF
jgi:hypothetical protein